MATLAGLLAAVIGGAAATAGCLFLLQLAGFQLDAPGPRWLVYFIVGLVISAAVMTFQGTRHFVLTRPAIGRFLWKGVLLTVAVAITLFGGKEIYRTWKLHNTLLAAQSEFQKQLPKTLDGQTTLTAVSVGYTSWTYIYTLTSVQSDAQFFDLEKSIRDGVCSSGMSRMLKDGVSYRYEYWNTSKVFLRQFEIVSCP